MFSVFVYVCLFLSFRKTALRPYKFPFKDLGLEQYTKMLLLLLLLLLLVSCMKNKTNHQPWFDTDLYELFKKNKALKNT